MSEYKYAPSTQIMEEDILYQRACCDCGLIHDEMYSVVDGKVQLTVKRNNRSTGQYRRHNRITVRQVDIEKKKDDNTNRH